MEDKGPSLGVRPRGVRLLFFIVEYKPINNLIQSLNQAIELFFS